MPEFDEPLEMIVRREPPRHDEIGDRDAEASALRSRSAALRREADRLNAEARETDAKAARLERLVRFLAEHGWREL